LKQDREHQQQQQKQQKKKQIQDDDNDDDTIMTELTQESSLECAEIECNLIDDDDDGYDNNIVGISNQVIITMRINDGMDEEKLNWKWKQKQKWKHKWQEEKYSRKVKMKKKIPSVITNVIKAYSMSEEDVSRDDKTKGILKTIDQRRLKKKKRVPSQWPDHPT